MKTRQSPRGAIRAMLLLGNLAVALLGCTTATPPPAAPPPSGSVMLNQHDTNDYTGGGGFGSLFLDGTRYRFAITGLGVEGSALALMQATGEASHFDNIGRFPGVYRLAPAGQSGSDIWLQNRNGVTLHLTVPPGSRMPQLGNDSVLVRMDQ